MAEDKWVIGVVTPIQFHHIHNWWRRGPTFWLPTLVRQVAIALIVQAVGLHQDTWDVFSCNPTKNATDVDVARKHQYGLKLLFNCFLQKIVNEQQENCKKQDGNRLLHFRNKGMLRKKHQQHFSTSLTPQMFQRQRHQACIEPRALVRHDSLKWNTA